MPQISLKYPRSDLSITANNVAQKQYFDHRASQPINI